MKKLLGVAFVCLLGLTACGGSDEDPLEDSTRSTKIAVAATSVAIAKMDGYLDAAGRRQIEELIDLCREDPEAESDGKTIRQELEDLSSEVLGLDAELSMRLMTISSNDCK